MIFSHIPSVKRQVQVSRLTDEVDNHRADRERTAAERDAIKAQHSNLAEATSEFEGAWFVRLSSPSCRRCRRVVGLV